MRIDAYAARGPAMNGYYTWPALGYNATLIDSPQAVRTAIEDSTSVSFDLSPKSKSWKVLAAYIAREKRKQRRRR